MIGFIAVVVVAACISVFLNERFGWKERSMMGDLCSSAVFSMLYFVYKNLLGSGMSLLWLGILFGIRFGVGRIITHVYEKYIKTDVPTTSDPKI